MYYFTKASRLVKEISDAVRRNGIKSVETVHLKAGCLCGNAELARLYYALVTKETPLIGSTLTIDENSHTKQHCHVCRETQMVTKDDLVDHMFVCPTCGSLNQLREVYEVDIYPAVANGVVHSVTCEVS